MQHPDRIPSLDGWRAVAILAVIAAHVRDAALPVNQANKLQLMLMGLGHKGVEIFFCLSGFLITTKLLEETERTASISLRNFYHRRCFRILPAQYVYLFTLFLLMSLGYVRIGPADFASSLLFFRNSMDGSHYTAHFWSLAIEEQFYFVWPFLLLRLGVNRWKVFAPLAALLLELWHMADLHFHLTSFPGGDFRTDYNADALLWGCCLALWAAFIRAKVPTAFAGWLGAMALPASAALYVLHAPAREMWEPMLFSVAIAGTIFAPEFAIGRFLEFRALTLIGLWSYSLYLWQQLFFPPFGFPRILGISQRLPFSIFFLFLTAIGSYYLIEQPMIGLGKRLRSRSARTILITGRNEAAFSKAGDFRN